MIELGVLDANGAVLKVGAHVAWASASSGRRKIVKGATITDIKLDVYEGNTPGKQITISVAIDGGRLKDSRSQFVAEGCTSVTFSGIALD